MVGMQNGAVIMDHSMVVPQKKLNIELLKEPEILLLKFWISILSKNGTQGL